MTTFAQNIGEGFDKKSKYFGVKTTITTTFFTLCCLNDALEG